jgi:drug/metabolite transporter (DMT)-like permease
MYSIILYMAIFPSLLSFYFWNRGVAEIGANKTGQFTHLMPIFGAILAVVFLGEEIHFYHLVGMCLIGFGIYLSIFLGKKST